MNKPFRPTLNDVAIAAGVSTATVSRCLNEPDRVVSQTRERVLRAVDELGYTPDFGGRALASRQTKTVGAIIPTMENAMFARGVQAFQEALSEAGVTLLVASSGYDMSREAEQIRTLIGRGADGLLLIGSARPQSTYDFLNRRNIPYVLTWTLNDLDEHFVGFDNVRAAEAIATKVLEFGHKNIGMIAGITDMNDRAADRVKGVQAALQHAGYTANSISVVEAAYTLDDSARAFDKLMSEHPRTTAIICGNDVLAAGAIRRARQVGLAVPKDISITGFDDIDIAEIVDPPLTTVHVPHRRMGAAAAQLLLSLIAKEPTQKRVEIGVEIILRGSLGPARKT